MFLFKKKLFFPSFCKPSRPPAFTTSENKSYFQHNWSRNFYTSTVIEKKCQKYAEITDQQIGVAFPPSFTSFIQ